MEETLPKEKTSSGDPVGPMPLTKRIAAWLVEKDRVKAAEDKTKKDKAANVAEGALIIAQMGAEEVDRLTVAGKTVSISRHIFMNAIGGQSSEFHEAMKKCGAGELVKPSVNSRTLDSWAKELPRDPDTDLPEIPEELKDLVTVGDVYKLGARKG